MSLLNKLFPKSKRAGSESSSQEPLIVLRDEHSLSRAQISPNALKVLDTLNKAGFEAYLVGGCVRDLLLGFEPKDFDVATNASPEEVHRLFRKSRLIGRRFKLVHVGFGRDVIEVATFRAPPEETQHIDEQGRIVQDNVFGTLEQDAWRRDFTINALYYNVRDHSIVDYTGGIADLQAGRVRLIGEVETRYREDPVRMLRALRFVAKLQLELDADTEAPIRELARLLQDIPAARLFDEVLKLYLTGYAVATHQLLLDYGVFAYLFPQTASVLQQDPEGQAAKLLLQALNNTDQRILQDKPVTPAFLFAAVLWGPVVKHWQSHQEKKVPMVPALQYASTEVISKQIQTVAVPKRFTLVTRDIWMLQTRLAQRHGKRAFRALTHPKFRAGYDFLLLRAESGEALDELAEWWTQFQFETESVQQQMVAKLAPTARAKSNRRRRRRRRSSANKPQVHNNTSNKE